jgi:hypothetical protein
MKTRKHKWENKDELEVLEQSFRDLEDLQHEELSGVQNREISIATSSTDEDENEGLGDGNIGRSKNSIIRK